MSATPGGDMPLFSNPQDPNPGAWEPEAAEGRLAKTVGASEAGVFTSDLSVSEYVLLGEAGFEPLGFVVGSSIYHVGLQVSRWGKNTELQVLTQAMYNARELAMARMRAEADHLAADGIVGVQLRLQMYAWGESCLEFVATGTAVRHLTGQGSAPRARRPRVHLGPVRPGLLPAAGRRRSTGRLRPRYLRLPHRPPGHAAVDAPGRPEPGDAAVHPGRLRGARAGAGPDAGRGCAGPVVRDRRRHGGCQESRLGRARDRVPGHRHRRPAAQRGAPAAGNLPQAHLHPRPGQLGHPRKLATSSAPRLLITRSAEMPNFSARTVPLPSQSSCPGACASVSMANRQPASAASPSSRSGGSMRSGRQLISTATPCSRHALNTASGLNTDSGRRPRPPRWPTPSSRPVQWPSTSTCGLRIAATIRAVMGPAGIRSWEWTLATTTSSRASRSSRWSSEPSSRMSTSIPVRIRNGASSAFSASTSASWASRRSAVSPLATVSRGE